MPASSPAQRVLVPAPCWNQSTDWKECGATSESNLERGGANTNLSRRSRLELQFQVGRNLLAVEASIFDENLVRARSCHDDSGYVNPAHIALERHRVAYRPALLFRKFNSHAAQKIVVGMVANQRQHKIILQSDRPPRSDDHNVIHADFLHRTAEVRLDLSGFDAVLEVWLDPVLHMMMNLRLAMHERHSRPMPPQIK